MLQTILLAALWTGCQFADVKTTMTALRNPNVVEGNPIFGNNKRIIIGVKIATNGAMLPLWAKKSKGKARVAMPLIAAGAGCTAAVYNSRVTR